jgi:NadR type nicotinamide-nucleotide adenylyltransferase
MKKIVVIGPESTGKSSICEQLANHYNTSWCPEYAREYLLENGTAYTYEDLLTIAKGQLELEEVHTKNLLARTDTAEPFLFIDTDMYVMKVWCEYVFDQCHSFILDQIATRQYDLYFLCDTDIPWTKDKLREYPDLASRQHLFKMYKDLLVNQSVPWTILTGSPEQRLSKAQETIKQYLF